jgi:hypothetical protein
MKIITNVVAILILSLAMAAFGQEKERKPMASPKAKVMQTIGVTDITVTYHRPAVKDRTIWGELVPYDKVWRAGANNATKIEFSNDVTVQGQPLSAGAYSFFLLPAKSGEWTAIFNNVDDQWGAYNYDESQDALRIKVQPQESDHTERLTYHFTNLTKNSAHLVMKWEKTALPIEITEK